MNAVKAPIDPDNRVTPAAPSSKVTKTLITLTTRVTVPGAGLLTQKVTSKARSKVTTQCSTQASPSGAGAIKLTCKIGKAGRKALSKGALTLTLRTSFTPAGGTKATKVQTLKLKRSR